MFKTSFDDVFLESYSVHLPERELTSTEIESRLGPLYEQLDIPIGTLERLSGIVSRRMFPLDMRPSEAATVAARQALAKSEIDPVRIGVLVNCSVTRDYFEPATATVVHANLGLREDAAVFDLTNACLGFSNGIQIVGLMIESGAIDAGLIVSAEQVAPVLEHAIEVLLQDRSLSREGFLRALPTFTLGCGAVAAVLCRGSLCGSGHRFVGCTARSATQYHGLCKGNADCCYERKNGVNPIMETDARGIVREGGELGARCWADFASAFGWSRDQVDHVFMHNIGRQNNDHLYETMGHDYAKSFHIYEHLGNLASASLPAALFTGVECKPVRSGEKIVLLGFGSGLNSMCFGIDW